MKYIKKKLLNYLIITSFFLICSSSIYSSEQRDPLITAIAKFELKTVQSIIACAIKFPDELYPLHFAVETANKYSRDIEKMSILEKIIIFLIDNGAKKNLLDYRGQTPLDIALDFNNKGLALFLINLYTTQNETILHRLVFIANDYQKANKLNIVKSLEEISLHILKTHPEIILSIDEKRKTAFDYALEGNNILLINTFTPFFEIEKSKKSELNPRVDRTLKPKKDLSSDTNPVALERTPTYEKASSSIKNPSLYDDIITTRDPGENDYLIPGKQVNFKKEEKSSPYEVNWE